MTGLKRSEATAGGLQPGIHSRVCFIIQVKVLPGVATAGFAYNLCIDRLYGSNSLAINLVVALFRIGLSLLVPTSEQPSTARDYFLRQVWLQMFGIFYKCEEFAE